MYSNDCFDTVPFSRKQFRHLEKLCQQFQEIRYQEKAGEEHSAVISIKKVLREPVEKLQELLSTANAYLVSRLMHKLKSKFDGWQSYLDKKIQLEFILKDFLVEFPILSLLEKSLEKLSYDIVFYGIEDRVTRKKKGKPRLAILRFVIFEEAQNLLIKIVYPNDHLNKTLLSNENSYKEKNDLKLFSLLEAQKNSLEKSLVQYGFLPELKIQLERLGGRLSIHINESSNHLFLKIPLRPKQQEVLFVQADNMIFAIPQKDIVYTGQSEDTTCIENGDSLVISLTLDHEIYSCCRLNKVLNLPPEHETEEGEVFILVKASQGIFALLLRKCFCSEVVYSLDLPACFYSLPYLGMVRSPSGELVPLLNLERLAERAALTLTTSVSSASLKDSSLGDIKKELLSKAFPWLIFKNREKMVIPAYLVTSFEKILSESIFSRRDKEILKKANQTYAVLKSSTEEKSLGKYGLQIPLGGKFYLLLCQELLDLISLNDVLYKNSEEEFLLGSFRWGEQNLSILDIFSLIEATFPKDAFWLKESRTLRSTPIISFVTHPIGKVFLKRYLPQSSNVQSFLELIHKKKQIKSKLILLESDILLTEEQSLVSSWKIPILKVSMSLRAYDDFSKTIPLFRKDLLYAQLAQNLID